MIQAAGDWLKCRVATIINYAPSFSQANDGVSRFYGLSLWPFEHLRQPDESWSSIPFGTCQWLEGRFFSSPVPSGMNLDVGGVHGHRFDFNAHDLSTRQLLKHPIEHTGLG